jgi:hypothetical protein
MSDSRRVHEFAGDVRMQAGFPPVNSPDGFHKIIGRDIFQQVAGRARLNGREDLVVLGKTGQRNDFDSGAE